MIATHVAPAIAMLESAMYAMLDTEQIIKTCTTVHWKRHEAK